MDKAKLNVLLARQEAKRTELHMVFVDKVAEFHGVPTSEERTKAADKLRPIS